MEKIDILLKAVLELKEQVTVLSYKMDNIENMLASSVHGLPKEDGMVEPNSEDGYDNTEETAEEKLVRLYNQKKKEVVSEDPEPVAEDFDLGEPEDPFEEKKNLSMSSEDLSAYIKSECKQAFPSDSSINEEYINQSLTESKKKDDVSSTTKATLEEVKKRVDEFMDMNKLQYNINKHI